MQKNSDAFRCPSHAARRQQHIMPSGARSVGAAILLPMITSEVAGIEERAVLAAAASSHALQRCSSTRARPGGEKSRPACKVCCCCRRELQSSARPRTSRGRLLLSFPATSLPPRHSLPRACVLGGAACRSCQAIDAELDVCGLAWLLLHSATCPGRPVGLRV